MRTSTRSLGLATLCLLAVQPAFGALTLPPVSAGSRLAMAGLTTNDVVFFVGHDPSSSLPPSPQVLISTVADLQNQINARGGSVRLTWRRGSGPIQSTILPASTIASNLGVSASPTSNASYTIRILTGTATVSPAALLSGDLSRLGDGPGTDANVTIQIVGSLGTVPVGPISGSPNGFFPGQNLFERGQTDVVTVNSAMDVGDLRSVTIQRDGSNPFSGDWQISRIAITKNPLPSGAATTKRTMGGSQWLFDTSPISMPLF